MFNCIALVGSSQLCVSVVRAERAACGAAVLEIGVGWLLSMLRFSRRCASYVFSGLLVCSQMVQSWKSGYCLFCDS